MSNSAGTKRKSCDVASTIAKRQTTNGETEDKKQNSQTLEKRDFHLAAVILARGGSKGIPLKNIKSLAGIPLVAWVIRACIDSDAFDSVWVSTDHERIAEIATQWGAKVHRRSPEVARDQTSSVETLQEFAFHRQEVDAVGMIQCTCPTLHPEDLVKPCDMLRSGYDSVFAVTRVHRFRWKEVDPAKGEITVPLNINPAQRPRRQDWPGELVENGSYYFCTREMLDTGNNMGGKVAYVEMSAEHSSDIDTPLDWEEVEQRIMKYGYHGRQKRDVIKMVVVNADKALLDEQVFVTGDGQPLFSYSSNDISSLKILMNRGVRIRLISGQDVPAIHHIAKMVACPLQINCQDAVKRITEWMEEETPPLKWSNVAYIGGDLSDVPVLSKCGFGFTCEDAEYLCIQRCCYVSKRRAGRDAVRDIAHYMEGHLQNTSYKSTTLPD